ncbi:MAG: InlB B-repeat-containing protein [Oscillospiraceae bacterium]|nr:InlB B-repeat-containing protein [Oscillospiraceae bacterium]
MKKRILSALLVVALFLTAFANVSAADRNSLDNFQKQASYTAGQFADVAPGAWYEDNVKSAYELGLMVGTSGTAFDPEGQLSIAQAVTIAARLHNVYAGNGETFAPGTPWYQVYMDYAAIHGMLVPADYPDPEALATRAEYAAILSAAFPDEALTPLNTVNAIPDVPADADYAPAVLRLYRAGILKGNDASGTFAPDRGINRAEVAAMVTRMADPALRLRFTLPGQETGDTVTVTFDWNYGGKAPQTVEVPIGQPVPEPEQPTRTLFRFDGWFNPMNGFVKYDFSAPVYEDITLYAHWSTVVKDAGKEPEPLPSPEPSEEPVIYTVTFDSNGGSAIAAQAVEKGKTVQKPANPTKEGFSFLGWYKNPELSQLYHFDEVVTANFTLYAKWESEGESFFTLRADKTDVLIGNTGSGVVRFYLETNLVIDSVPVFAGNPTEEDLEPLLYLYDNGQYEGYGDDIAGDGIYSGILSTLPVEETTVKYFAVNGELVSSFEIRYFAALSAETIEKMDEANLRIVGLIYSDEYVDAEKEDREAAVKTLLESLKADGLIVPESVHYIEEYALFSFEYADGVLGGIQIEDFKPEFNGIGQSVTPEITVAELLEDQEPPTNEAESWFVDANNDIGTALILNAFPSFETEATQIAYRTTFYETLRNKWDAATLTTTLDTDVTVNDFKNFGSYNVVVIATHGGTYAWFDNEGNYHQSPSICLTEPSTDNSLYDLELKEGMIVAVNGRYRILPKFFEEYYEGEALEDTFVFSECCEFFGAGGGATENRDFSMANALRVHGAKAVVGFHNSVFADYSRELMEEYVQGLIDGHNSQEAYDAAVQTMGANHADWFLNTRGRTLQAWWEDATAHGPICPPDYGPGTYNPAWHIAYPHIQGDANALLVRTGILNGDFEQYVISGSVAVPKYWSRKGDVRSMTQLGDAIPAGESNMRMGAISSGIGSLTTETFGDGTEGSRISQRFIVPKDVSTLRFQYNFISEEPLEWIGSKFDDMFGVALVLKEGIAFQKIYESINTSEWIPINNVNFDGGDQTAFQTGWKAVVIDVSAYRGMAVTLSFVVYDKGDSIYDSACLIDNVELK